MVYYVEFWIFSTEWYLPMVWCDNGQVQIVDTLKVDNLLLVDSMVVEMVPLKGGIGSIVHPPIGSIYHLYTTYILPSFGGYIIPTTLYRNLKNPLIDVSERTSQ